MNSYKYLILFLSITSVAQALDFFPITSEGVILNSNTIEAGENISVKVRIGANQNNAYFVNVYIYLTADPNNPYDDRYYLGKIFDVAPRVIGTGGIPGSYFSGTFKVPTNQSLTDAYVFIIIDAFDEVTESNENNNTFVYSQASEAVRVTHTRPDLRSRGSSYTYLSPITTSSSIDYTEVEAGSPFSIFGSLSNTGAVESPNARINLYASNDSSITNSDVLLGVVNISSIEAGSYSNFQKQILVPSSLSQGTYYVGWIIDPADQIDESSESNNKVLVPNTRLVIVPPAAPDVSLEVDDVVIVENQTVNLGSIDHEATYKLDMRVKNTGNRNLDLLSLNIVEASENNTEIENPLKASLSIQEEDSIILNISSESHGEQIITIEIQANTYGLIFKSSFQINFYYAELSYLNWIEQAGFFGQSAEAIADPDRDGISNLMSYALGLNHSSSGKDGMGINRLPSVEVNNDYRGMAIHIPLPSPEGIVYIIESAGTIKDLTEIARKPWDGEWMGTNPPEEVVNSEVGQNTTYKKLFLKSNDQTLKTEFYRLKVQFVD